MLTSVQLIRNIGQFESVSSANLPITRLTLIYAENGRGKTTLAAILRSLATGDPLPINERRRLSATSAPHVVLACTGAPQPAVFQNGIWSRSFPDISVFDDAFVDENVCSGLEVAPGHRQSLHELILGAHGVSLNRQLKDLVSRIEEHNRVLREKAGAIPASIRGNLSVDDFCGLPETPDVDDAIEAAERNLSAARQQEPVQKTGLFDAISLPSFNADEIEVLLQRDLPSLDSESVTRVQEHLARIGENAEAWASDGMCRLDSTNADNNSASCPFCAQDLSGSPIIDHYRAYFSQAYSALKRTVAEMSAAIDRAHGGDVQAGFERAVRTWSERRQFWGRFCELPTLELDTAEIVRCWQAAHRSIADAMRSKQMAPLERLTLSSEAREAITVFEGHRARVSALSDAFQQANSTIRVVKEQAATSNAAAIQSDLLRLKAIKARFEPAMAALCADYVAEKAAKATTEQQRDQTKEALEQHRQAVFPTYETAINEYLRRFNASFRLANVTAADTRGGPTCTYCVVVDSTSIPIAVQTPTAGSPSFRTALSSGDRNTLALAFFFASLDHDPGLANKIVVIDDPMTSLDDHRSLTTVQEVRRLADRAAQVIVLSHNMPFLCRIWEGADTGVRTALHVARDGNGSTIAAWDVNQDCITEHDRRHAQLREYTNRSTANDREVARALRPVLEAFIRVACPEFFQPGSLLGPFINICEQRLGAPNEVLDEADTRELKSILEYANKFHHDTNLAWQTVAINDAELLSFVNRTIAFAKR